MHVARGRERRGQSEPRSRPFESGPQPPSPPAPTSDQQHWLRRRPVAWSGPGFPRLVLAWLFTNLADSTLYLMTAVWVKDLTGSDGAAAVVFALLGLPALIAPLLGQLADRYSRRRVLGLAKLGVAACVLTLLLVDGPELLWLVYLVVLVYGSMNYLTAAAQAGLVRDMLRDDQLASANGLLSTIDQTMRLLAPLLGAALYAFVGPRAVIALTATAFAVAAVLLLTLQLEESPPQSKAERGSLATEVLAGFRHLRSVPLLGRLTLLVAVGFSAVGLVNVAVFPVMEQGLGVPAATLGLLVSVQGVGAIAGGMSASTLIGRHGEARVFALGMGLLGLGVLSLVTHNMPVTLIGLVAVGLGVTWVVVSFTTFRQRSTPPRLQGRTASATNVAVNLPQTMLTLVGAALVGVLDHRLLVAATAVGVLVAAGLALSSPRADPPAAS